MMDLILSPILGSQGVEWKEHKVPRSGKTKPRTEAEEKQREDRLIASLARSPFGIRTVQTSDPGDTSDG